jgi:hypothetical protein
MLFSQELREIAEDPCGKVTERDSGNVAIEANSGLDCRVIPAAIGSKKMD